MDYLNYLYACLSEECGEIVQVVGKIHRFGPTDYHSKSGNIPNHVLIANELNDLFAIAEMLGFELDEEAIKAKQEKVRKYMEYSKELGTLDD